MTRRAPLAATRRRNRRVDHGLREERRTRGRRTARLAILVAVLGLGGWHLARLGAARDWLDLFRVREVRVTGVRVANPAVLVAEAGLMGAEVYGWSSLGPYAERAARDPLVHSARLERGFPNRLTLEIVERTPVALLALDRLAPVDSSGRVLPVDAFRAGWDVPVVRVPWRAADVAREGRVRIAPVRTLVGWLGEVGRRYPALAREISALELDAGGTVTVRLVHGDGVLLLDQDTPVEKLALVDDVLRDLHEKGIAYARLDLRFADQIVVRRAGG